MRYAFDAYMDICQRWQLARMELEGQLNPALSLPEVLQFLSMGKMTGCLTIVHGNNTVKLQMLEGKLVNSSSLQRPRRLGQMLMNRNLIDRASLETALKRQKESDPQPLLGSVLIDLRLVTPDQLGQAIKLQLEEELWDLIALQSGSFKFEHGSRDSIGDVQVELGIEPLLAEHTRRLEEWTRIIKNIPGDSAIPGVRAMPDASERELMNFSENEWNVLSLINGFYSVGSIANRSGIGRFETYRILNSFLASGYVQIRKEEASEIAGLDFDASKSDAGKSSSRGTESVGSSSARLMAMLVRKFSGEPYAPDADRPVEPPPRLTFKSPVGFVAGLANALIGELITNPDFYLGPSDDVLAEQYWRHVVMSYPKADLISATNNRLDPSEFEGFAEYVGLNGPFKSVYEDTLEALGRFLKMVFLLASQRLGMKSAQRLFSVYSKDFQKRSTITNGTDFSFDNYAGKVYA